MCIYKIYICIYIYHIHTIWYTETQYMFMTYTCNKSKYRYNEHSFANRRIFYTYIYISNKYIQRERGDMYVMQ